MSGLTPKAFKHDTLKVHFNTPRWATSVRAPHLPNLGFLSVSFRNKQKECPLRGHAPAAPLGAGSRVSESLRLLDSTPSGRSARVQPCDRGCVCPQLCSVSLSTPSSLRVTAVLYSSLHGSASPHSKITARRLHREHRKECVDRSGPAVMPAWTLKHKPKATS